MVQYPLMVRWVVGSILHGRPIELFLVLSEMQLRGTVSAHGAMGYQINNNNNDNNNNNNKQY